MLRSALWPHSTSDEHLAEINELLAEPKRYAQWLAYTDTGLAVGLAEVSLRSDYVNGTETSPVAFLEGIYVLSEYRRLGIASQLVACVAEWASERGCREFASDALLDNEMSLPLHKALGFEITERVVFFRKVLN